MRSDARGPRFHEVQRDGMPMDVGLFWEPDADELARRLQESEGDRVTRLARIEEIWADRTAWIDRYNAVDANQRALARERDALMLECEGLRGAVVQARDLRARERHQFTSEQAAAEGVRATLAAERDSFAAEREAFVAERTELRDHIAAIEADRDAVGMHRDALAADRDAQAAAREAAESRLAATASGATPLLRIARRILRS